MRTLMYILTLVMLISVAGCNTAPVASHYTVSAQDDADWIVLFDGSSLDQFRTFQSKDIPANSRWQISEGTLHYTGGKFGGDIITKRAFGDFDLRWEWKISEGGNSGVKYRVDSEKPQKKIYALGLEYQVLDDDKHSNGKTPTMTAGALYSLIAPKPDKPLKPVGQWNESRVVLKNNRVQHYLNGEVVVEYEIGSEQFNELVAKSKYRDEKDFGKINPGHIALQDHVDKVWYRNIRILELKDDRPDVQ